MKQDTVENSKGHMLWQTGANGKAARLRLIPSQFSWVFSLILLLPAHFVQMGCASLTSLEGRTLGEQNFHPEISVASHNASLFLADAQCPLWAAGRFCSLFT